MRSSTRMPLGSITNAPLSGTGAEPEGKTRDDRYQDDEQRIEQNCVSL